MKEPSEEIFNKERVRLINELDNLKATEGALIYRELTRLRTAIFIYKENYRILKKSLQKYHSDPQNIGINSVKRWRLQRILVKDFHNVIMSARAYVEQNNKNYLSDPFHCFMKELRNFIVHKEGLRLISKATTEEGNRIRYESVDLKNFAVYLDEQIQKHKDWNGLKYAKEYFSKLPNKVSFNKLLEEYDIKITSYHVDFFLSKVKANSTPLEELVKKVTALHQRAKELDMTTDYPITEAQLRHLRYLINSSC